MAESTYSQAVADEIVRRLSEGEPLANICRTPGFPAVRTVSDWRKAHPEFDKAFLEARDAGFDVIAADSLSIVDQEPERVQTEHGTKVDQGYVAWQKNRAEQRLKLLAKWDPRRYGDKMALEHSGSIQTLSDEEIERRFAELAAKVSSADGGEADGS